MIFKKLSVNAGIYEGMCMQVVTEAKREYQIPWNCSYRWCEPPEVGAENLILVICKSGMKLYAITIIE